MQKEIGLCTFVKCTWCKVYCSRPVNCLKLEDCMSLYDVLNRMLLLKSCFGLCPSRRNPIIFLLCMEKLSVYLSSCLWTQGVFAFVNSTIYWNLNWWFVSFATQEIRQVSCLRLIFLNKLGLFYAVLDLAFDSNWQNRARFSILCFFFTVKWQRTVEMTGTLSR